LTEVTMTEPSPKTATAARELLLTQHTGLRHLLADAEELARRLSVGQSVTAALADSIAALRRALAQHNQTEESLLEPLLSAAPDAYGPARIQRMLDEHKAEHAAMRAALARGIPEVAAGMVELAEMLRAHLDAEERTFLHPAVLRESH
jgi:hypothetical protein